LVEDKEEEGHPVAGRGGRKDASLSFFSLSLSLTGSLNRRRVRLRANATAKSAGRSMPALHRSE
jgi:hypothetical protein